MGDSDLSQPIDVYSEWIDACDAVAKDNPGSGGASIAPATRQPQVAAASKGGAVASNDKYDTEDGFVEDDEADAEADFVDDD